MQQLDGIVSIKAVLQGLIISFKSPLKLSLTLVISCASYLMALALRFDMDPSEVLSINRLYLPTALLLTFRLASYTYFNLHEGYWRHSSIRDFKNILLAHSASTVLFTASILLFRIDSFPRSVIFIEYALSILLAGGSRLLVRMFCEEFLSDYKDPNSGDTRNVIVLGAGNSGHLFIKTVLSHKRLGYRPLLVLDDDERLQGFRVHSVKVEGKISDLALKLKEHSDISSIIIAIPTISQSRLHEIETIAKGFNIPIKRLQSFENIALEGTFAHDGITSVETILDRQVTESHEAEIREQINGKRILVTGAGGSIGSEIVRQIIRFNPARVVLFDASEYNLFRTELEFSPIYKNVQKRFVIGSITDTQRVAQIFNEEKPQIVFHAAAYKHVPLMEYNCSQAFLNNVIGTWKVLEASSKNAVERFVLISTDKAIDPSSVMGCSKRLAEIIVQQFSNGLGKQTNPNGDSLSTSVVRFGNVINSTGSVVPLFREQILSGGPVTVTHPDIERYFMSIQEAVHLVLTAGTLGERGEVYVLDMGQRIKIVDVAKKMLALYGRPDIPIVFSGLRPGEKLTEELIGKNEKLQATSFTKVSRLECPPMRVNMAESIKGLYEELPTLTDAEVGQRMHKLVDEFVKTQSIASLEARRAMGL